MYATVLEWIALQARKYLIWMEVRQAKQYNADPAMVERLAIREIVAIGPSIDAFLHYQKTESQILTERLSRRYDLGMALNEAANRAMEIKRAARESMPVLTSYQKQALEVQRRTVQASVDRA